MKISLADYRKRELALLNDKNSRFKSNWSKRYKRIKKLFDENNYKNYCSSSNVSKDEYCLIIYDIISQICINNSFKKLQGIDKAIKREIVNRNKVMNASVKMDALNYLFSLVGGYKFTDYYMEKIYLGLSTI